MFTLSKTLGRRSQLLSGANTGEPILSGIVHVTLNNVSLHSAPLYLFGYSWWINCEIKLRIGSA